MFCGPKSPFNINIHPKAPAQPGATFAPAAVWRSRHQRAALMSTPAPERATQPAPALFVAPVPPAKPQGFARARAFLAATLARALAPLATLRRNRGNK